MVKKQTPTMDCPIRRSNAGIFTDVSSPLPPVADIALRLVGSDVQCGRFYSKHRTKSIQDFETQSQRVWCVVMSNSLSKILKPHFRRTLFVFEPVQSFYHTFLSSFLSYLPFGLSSYTYTAYSHSVSRAHIHVSTCACASACVNVN